MEHIAPEIRKLLRRMEAEMHRVELWSTTPPEPAAFASTAPFCFDTMEFHQWLQWVFIPRMHALLDRCGELPLKSEIAPLAEMAFAELDADTDQLLGLVERFDSLAATDHPTPCS
ncbi:MAG: YqcC family protein [Pseudomonadota bacterium]